MFFLFSINGVSLLRHLSVLLLLLSCFFFTFTPSWNLKEQKVRYVRVATHDVSRDDRFADATPFLIHSIRSASAKIKDLEPFTYHQRVATMVLLETTLLVMTSSALS